MHQSNCLPHVPPASPTLQKATATLAYLESKLGQSEILYRQQQDATVGRLRYLQRQGSSWGWATLLQSYTVTDFLDRRYRLGRVYRTDRQTLQRKQCQI